MSYSINTNLCIECGQCRRFCPIAGAIIINQDYQHTVVADLCTGCGLCEAFCPVPNALTQAERTTPGRRVRLRLLRRVFWRGQWLFHNHPLMSPLIARSHRRLRLHAHIARSRKRFRQGEPAYSR